MAFRRWKQILVLVIIGWMAMIGYVALSDFFNCGRETNQLQRAKRVLDKSEIFIDKLTAEINSLKEQVKVLKRNCNKKCPVVRAAIDRKYPTMAETIDHEISTEETKYFSKRIKSRDKSNLDKNTTIHEAQYQLIQVPGLEMEKTRRRASKEHREMWYYLSAEVTKINKLLGSSLKARLTAILDNFAEIHRALGNNLDKINNQEALSTWRKEEQAKVSKIIQHRLRRLQNPPDCETANKLICDLNKGCGYGCQVHHLLYCFITAYGTKRTLIINSQGWRYSDRGWETVFLPASKTCTTTKGPITTWSTDSDKSKNVQLPIVDGLFPQPKHLPLAVPADLVDRIQLFHGFPFVWWMGQFAKYLFQYRPEVKKEMDEKKEKLGFKTPIVG